MLKSGDSSLSQIEIKNHHTEDATLSYTKNLESSNFKKCITNYFHEHYVSLKYLTENEEVVFTNMLYLVVMSAGVNSHKTAFRYSEDAR